MDKKAIKQLYKIAELRGIDGKSGVEARKKAIEEWISYWVEEVTFSQAVIKSNFSSDEHDFIIYYLCYKLGEQLMDQGFIEAEIGKNKVSTGLLALKSF